MKCKVINNSYLDSRAPENVICFLSDQSFFFLFDRWGFEGVGESVEMFSTGSVESSRQSREYICLRPHRKEAPSIEPFRTNTCDTCVMRTEVAQYTLRILRRTESGWNSDGLVV